jgi:hypothetical protein
MADHRGLPSVGPGAAPQKWLLGVGFVGLLMVAPGVAVGCFEGFQDDTEAGAFAWLMMFFGGLLVVVTAWIGAMLRLGPEARRKERRRTALRQSRQAPLPAAELTYESLREAATRSTTGTADPRPPAPVTDGREQLVWWRSRSLLTAVGLPRLAAWTAFAALAGTGGFLHVLGGTIGHGLFFLACSVYSLVMSLSGARLARVLARVAVSEHVRPMRWLLVREPEAGAGYLVLYPAEEDPDGAAPMLLRIAEEKDARSLPPTGVAEVHGPLRPATVLVPWIDGSPVWTFHPVAALDLTTEHDRAVLTYLKGSQPLGR